MIRRRQPRKDREPTIALINIVFLMLIFFLVAGTLAAPLDPDLSLVKTADLDGSPPADALVIHADGSLAFQGVPVASASEFMQGLPEEARGQIRLVPDRELQAAELVHIGAALRAEGAEQVTIVTERGL